MDLLGDAENSTFYRTQLNMKSRVTPQFSGNRVLKECLFSQGFQRMDILGDAENPTFYR